MAPGRDQIVLQASEALKEALQQYAQDNDVSMAEVIRRAVANEIGYDYAGEEKPRRAGRKYANEEERKQANLDRAKIKRQIQKEINEAVMSGNITLARELALKIK